MSYCRFVEAGAYIYDDVRYGLICCVCSLMPLRESTPNKFFPETIMINDNFIAEYDYDKMLDHVAEHRAAGHYIPEHVDEELIKDKK
jgi:hypothetical protein